MNGDHANYRTIMACGGSVTSPTTQISDMALVRQFPPLLVYFPCFRHISSPKCVLPISTTPPPPIFVLFPCVRQNYHNMVFCPILRQNPQVRQPIFPTNVIPTSPTKIFYPLLRQLYPVLRQRYFTHFSDNFCIVF